jgi:hypothetical protein
MRIGGSAGIVFSYRKATMLGSSRKLVRRSGCFCRTLPNLDGNMALFCELNKGTNDENDVNFKDLEPTTSVTGWCRQGGDLFV